MDLRQTPEIKFAQAALKAYGLAHADGVVLSAIPTARSRTVLKVEMPKDARYIIRVSDSAANHLLENEIHITAQLARTNLKSAAPIPYAAEQMFYTESPRTAVVMRFIDGQHPVAGKVSEATARRLGEALAQFHTVVTGLPHGNSDHLLSRYPTDWPQHKLTTAQLAGIRQLEEVAGLFNAAKLPSGIIHGDFHTNNILLDGDDIALLDFEHSGQGILLLDIARSALDICQTDRVFNESLLTAYIAGYEAIRSLTAEEWKMFRSAFAYAALVVSYWFYTHDLMVESNQFIGCGIAAVKLLNSASYQKAGD